MEQKDRVSRKDRQSGDGFSRSPGRLNFDRICLNNLDLSSLGAAAAPTSDEQKLDNSVERQTEIPILGDETEMTEALLSRMQRLINTYPRSAVDQLSRLRASNRNGSLTSLDRTMGLPSHNNNLSIPISQFLAERADLSGPAVANNLRDRNASGSNSGVGVGSGDLVGHQMRNDLRSANATSHSLSVSESSITAQGDCGLSHDSRMSGMNRIVSQLMQIRESIQQANASINSVSEKEHSPETTIHITRMQELIQKLRQQEEAYIQLLSQMVDEDRVSRDDSVDRQDTGDPHADDEVESVDVPDFAQPSDGENTAESSSGAVEVTQSDTAYVEDAYAELEQLRCQRDMLREILSQHEELRALQGRQVALLKMQRETQQQLLEARDNPDDATSEDVVDEENDEVDLEQLMLIRRGTDDGGTKRREEIRDILSHEHSESNDQETADEDKESDFDPLNDPLMSTAVPRELLELRRRLHQMTVIRQQQQQLQGAGASSSVLQPSNGLEGEVESVITEADSEYARLTKSKAELSDRLKDLQSKKDHLDSLLMQLQTLRDIRSSQEVEGESDERQLIQETESTTSSLRQLTNTREVGDVATTTAKDAEEAIRLIEAQRKLSKLKEVRERLDRVRSMMTYYQDATAFIHSDLQEDELSNTAPEVSHGKIRGTEEACQRILDYGSTSETSSHNSEPVWRPPMNSRTNRPIGGGLLNGGQTKEISKRAARKEHIQESHQGHDPKSVERPRTSRDPQSIERRRRSRDSEAKERLRAAHDGDDISLGSEQIWDGHPSLLDRIRQLKVAKNRLNQLQSLITAIEAGASLSELPGDLASVAAELITEETNNESEEESAGEQADILLSSYKSAVENQKRELSQLMGERDKLLALQRQMEQLHAALPSSSSVWTRSDRKDTTEAAEVALRSLRLRPPSSSSAAAASMEALTAALRRDEENEATSTASTQQSHTGGSSGGRRPDTVTFQEPVATFVANDEVYENICAQRIMREELREKKREIAAIMKKDNSSGGYKRNQGGSTAGTDNQSMDTALGTLYSQDMTTAATWGEGSVIEADAEDGEAGADGIEEDGEETNAQRGFVDSLNAATQHIRLQGPNNGSLASPNSLQAQISTTTALCRAMLAEHRKLVTLIKEQNLRQQINYPASELFSATSVAPPTSNWQQNFMPMVYSSVNFCCQRLVQLQSDVLQLQQQISMKTSTGLSQNEGPTVPPLDLSSMRRQSLRQHHSGVATTVSKEPQYRPGVSSGISGTGYTETGDDAMSLLSAATDDDAGHRNPQTIQPFKKQLKQHNLQDRSGKPNPSAEEIGLFEALRETIYAEVASLISQNESRPNYLIDLFRELQLLSSDYLRQRVLYAIQDLVNKSLVHQSSRDTKIFAPRESWLRASGESYAEEQTPSESLITTDDDGCQDNQLKLYNGTLKKLEAKTSQLFQQRSDGNARKPGLFSTITDSLGVVGLVDQASADYAEEVETVSSLSTPQASPFAADSLGDTVIHLDKRMSPLSPISNSSRQETQTMQLLRDLEEQRQQYHTAVNKDTRLPEGEADRNSEISSTSETGVCPNVDPQQLNEEIRGVIHFLVPMLKQVSPQLCNSSLLQWIKELIMRRIRVVIARLHAGSDKSDIQTGEFDRFFDKQLSGLLHDNLKQYEGKLLAECIEDLMVDVSELLFNELAFFKLISDLEQNPSSDDIDSKTNSPKRSALAQQREGGRDARMEAVAAVVTLALQGDEEELDNKRDDQMANEVPVSSSSSDENLSEKEDSCSDEDVHSSSVRAVLAPSETKPMTRIGSDEDDEEEEEETECHLRAECADTAVSYVDADEKDAMNDGCTEKSLLQSNEVEKTKDLSNGDDGELTLEDLPVEFNLSDCRDIIQTLPSGEAELAGSGDTCPPPHGVACDQRALGQ